MQQVISELERLRRRGRLMLIIQRAAVMLAWILGAAAAIILFDFALRLPSGFRLVLLLAGIVALGYGVWSYLRLAMIFQPSLTQLALRIENVMPGVAGRLASSVEFAAAGVDQSNALAARSVRETERRLSGESVASAMNSGRVWRDVAILLAVAGIVGALGIVSPHAAATGLQRLVLPYSGAKWPARTGVESKMADVLGGAAVHPRGQALPLRAQITKGDDNQRVEAWYRLRSNGSYGSWQRVLLTHQAAGLHERLIDTGAGGSGGAGAADQLEVYFGTADDRSVVERIALEPPPAVRRASLRVEPPAYAQVFVPVLEAELGQGLDNRAVTEVPSLIGSSVTLKLELNKPLPVPDEQAEQQSWLRETFGWDGDALPVFSIDEASPALWTLTWQLRGTRALPLNLVDEYGLRNAESIAFRIDAVEDHLPAVTITHPQSDETVLPTAVISLESQARDDVAIATLALHAHVQGKDQKLEDSLAQTPGWERTEESNAAEATIQSELEIAKLNVSEGDVVLVSGLAQDIYELDGVRHESVRSPVRRLRVISAVDFATQLRRQLAAVRQNAIRIEAMQSELQDDVIDDGVQPGMNRAQAQIGERIAGQREAVQDIERLVRQNRLEDEQLAEILHQTQDLLDAAGRAANRAIEAMEQRGQRSTDHQASDIGAPNATDQEPLAPGSAGGNQPEARETASPQPPSEPQRAPQEDASQAQTPSHESDLDQPASPQDEPIVDAQQEVRDELTDLIKLLDRDEDTWVIKRQIENLLEAQQQLEAQTTKLGEQTIGQQPQNLPEQLRTELDKIAQKQREQAKEARDVIEDARNRAKSLQQVDPQSAQGMQSAADTAERQQLDRDMEQAAQNIEQNQISSAGSRQQSAQSTLQQMLKDMQENRRAKAQQLVRQLASLIESIQRLITIQEAELNALALARDANEFGGLDRAMIRLNQNTQAVAGEARAAGQESRRIARSLDRAADAQGAAVIAFRNQPVQADQAEEAENRSLELLKEAKALAEELQQQTQEQETQRRREELMAAYRQFAEQQVSVREQTVELSRVGQMDRRQLVEARRLSSTQDEIRRGLNELRDITSEIMESPIFVHVHRQMDIWSAAASDLLNNGTANVDVTDRQQQIADSIGRLIEALEETMLPPPEFEPNQGGDAGGEGGQGGPPPLIPPVAQLKLLQGMQKQVYNLTKEIDSRSDLDDAQRRLRLRDLGQQQRELMDLGKQMIEALQSQGGPPPQPPNDPEAPPETPEGLEQVPPQLPEEPQ